MCLGDPEQPQNQKGRIYVFIIKILMVFQAIISGLNLGSGFIKIGVFGIFLIFVLCVIQHQLSYQLILINIFIGIYFAMIFLIFLLTFAQNKTNFTQLTGYKIFQFVQAIISFVFYVFCCIFLYYPYLQFKLCAYKNTPALKNYFQTINQGQQKPQNMVNTQYKLNYGNLSNEKPIPAEQKYQVSKGKGVVIG